MNAFFKTIIAPLIVFVSLSSAFGDPIQINDREYLLGYGSMEDWDATPDGNYLAAGGSHGVFFWDLVNETPPVRMNEHANGVLSVSVSDDGTRILSAGRDNAIVLYDAHSGEVLQRFSGHSDTVVQAEFFHNSDDVLTASHDKTVRIWNAQTGELLKTLKLNEAVKDCYLFNDDRRLYLSTFIPMIGDEPYQEYVSIFDIEEDRELAFLDSAIDSVLCGALTPDNEAVVTSGPDNAIYVYDANTGDIVRQIDVENRINLIAVSADGKNIIAANSRGRLTVYDFETGEAIKTIGSDDNYVLPDRLQATSKGLLFSVNLSRVEHWDYESNSFETLAQGFLFAGAETKMALSPSADLLIVGTNNLTKVWDLTTYECARTFDGEILRNNSIAITPERSRVMTVDKLFNIVRVWDYDAGEILLSHPCDIATQKQAALSPDGKTALVPLEYNQVAAFNVDDGEKLFELSTGYEPGFFIPYEDSYHSMLFTPDGTKLFYVGEDKTVRIRTLEPNADIQSFMVH